VPNQKLKEVGGHCHGICEKCNESFQVPNQEVETFVDRHDDCDISDLHHHHDRSPTLCPACRGPDASEYPEHEDLPAQRLRHNPMRKATESLATTHKLKSGQDPGESTPDKFLKPIVDLFDDPDLNKAFDKEVLEPKILEKNGSELEPAPGVGRRYTLVDIRLKMVKDVDSSLKELIKDLCANEAQLNMQQMPCGRPLPLLSELIERIWKRKDWPCPCGNPNHFFVKFHNLR